MKPKMLMNHSSHYAGQFYIPIDHSRDGIPRYLHADGIVRGSTFNNGNPSGYFATQAAAEAAIAAYKSRQAEAAK